MEPEKTSRERAEDLVRLLVPDWRPTPQQILWAIRIVFTFVIVLGILTLAGRPFNITLWQWLDLLIIPAVLAIGGYLFTRSENRAARVAAEQRAQDEALQAYLDHMSQILLDKESPLRPSEEGDEVRTLARARTLTVLPRLDSDRKARVVQFLHESELITRERPRERSIIYLGGAELGADLGADLSGANLRRASLSRADLNGADLSGANLSRAFLNKASLMLTELSEADLSEADLSEANLSAAKLNGADLSKARLSRAFLVNANLSGAKLNGAWMPTRAKFLKGAIMPNGQKYEEWLKSKGRG